MSVSTMLGEIVQSEHLNQTDILDNNRDDEDEDDDFNFRKVRAKSKINILESDDEELVQDQPTSKESCTYDQSLEDDDSGISDTAISQSQVHNLFKDKDLFDAEESDDDEQAGVDDNDDESNEEKHTTPEKNSKSTNKKQKNHKTLNTVKKQKDERLHIYRESQRLLRQSRVSLPYHQPEQKTLDYFLHRKKFVPARLKPRPDDLEILFESLDTSNSSTVKKEETTSNIEVTASIQPTDSNYCVSIEENLQISLKSDTPQDGANASVSDDNNLEDKTKEEDIMNKDTQDGSKQTPSKHKVQASTTSQTIVRRLLKENAFERFTPRLSGEPNSYIDFAEKKKTSLKNNKQSRKHIDDLKSKLFKLAESSSTNNVKTHAETNEVEVGNNNIENIVPGAQLLRLKNKLKVEIAAKRELARQKRFEIHAMDNEEGFAIEEEEEEEAELTDQTDTDAEEEQNYEEDEEEDEDVAVSQKTKIHRNVFIDDEAEDDDCDYNADNDDDDAGGDDDDDDRNDESETSMNDDHDAFREVGTPIKSANFDRNHTDTIDLYPNECDYKTHLNNSTCGTPKLNTSLMSNNSSESTHPLIMPSITPWQPGGGIGRKRKSSGSEKSQISDNDNSFFTSYGDITSRDDKEFSFLSPTSRNFRDDTQGDNTQTNPQIDVILNKEKYYRKQSEEGGSLSQLGVSQITLPNSIYGTPMLFKPNAKNGNSQDMDEILSLCSGKFSGSLDSDNEDSVENFVTPSSESQAMHELEGLCSGSFKSQFPDEDDDNTKADNSTPSLNVLNENEESNCSLFRKVKRKRIEDDDDDDENNWDSDKENKDEEEEQIDGEDIDEIDDAAPTKNRISEFFDEEAELSGSEASSDEEEPAEGDDVMEVEEGDNDELIPNDDILREQVGRVHNKVLLDEDKRDLRLMQEMYLQDGDLHSGKRRERKFRWRDVYENSQDMQNHSGSDEEDGDSDEGAWRVNRHERDVWIAKHKKENETVDVDVDVDDDAEKLNNLSMKVISRKSMDFSQSKPAVVGNAPSPKSGKKKKEKQPGSFLHRSDEFCKKFARSSDSNPNGVKNSRNFVFAAISPPSKTPIQKNSSFSVRKKLRLDPKALEQKINKQNKSIFGYL